MIRFIRWLCGFDPVDYWRHQATAESALRASQVATLERSRHEVTRRWDAALKRIDQVEGMLRQARSESARLREQLNLETGIRTLYEQVVIESGEQIIKNDGVTPRTLLGVFREVFVTAKATAEEWRTEGRPEKGEVTNLRATMNTALLPEPDPKVQPVCTCGHFFIVHDAPIGQPPIRQCMVTHDDGLRCSCRGYSPARGLLTERKRDGRVGDSGVEARPDRIHLFDYGPFPPTGPGHGNCNVCGRHYEHSVHRPSHPKWSPSGNLSND